MPPSPSASSPPSAPPWLVAPSAGEMTSDGDALVGQIMLGQRYLRLVDAHTDRVLTPLVPLLCLACERHLSFTDQLLCTRRRWGFGGTVPQPACFMNSLVGSNVEVRRTYDEQLAQGLMLMADVFCRCGAQVGYRFCGDKTPNGRNLHQVGRYGLVCSTIAVAPYRIIHPRPFGAACPDGA